MYQKQFDAIMTQTESEYIHLWEVLSQFKKQSGNEDFKGFMEFQHRLGTQLRKIQIAYDQISKKEKDLIRRKTDLNNNWFKKSLKKLHSMKNTLRCVSYIGRCLGDAFAYFFYQFDFETLDQHLRHEEVSNFPTRIGGVGELEIARRCRLIKDHFAIYHGITNMLRIGDFSLFNMKELK